VTPKTVKSKSHITHVICQGIPDRPGSDNERTPALAGQFVDNKFIKADRSATDHVSNEASRHHIVSLFQAEFFGRSPIFSRRQLGLRHSGAFRCKWGVVHAPYRGM